MYELNIKEVDFPTLGIEAPGWHRCASIHFPEFWLAVEVSFESESKHFFLAGSGEVRPAIRKWIVGALHFCLIGYAMYHLSLEKEKIACIPISSKYSGFLRIYARDSVFVAWNFCECFVAFEDGEMRLCSEIAKDDFDVTSIDGEIATVQGIFEFGEQLSTKAQRLRELPLFNTAIN